MTQTRAPLSPRLALPTADGASLERAAFALALRQVGPFANKPPADICRELWPNDRGALAFLSKGEKPDAIQTRAAQDLGVTTEEWGATLTQTATAAFFASLGPLSAMSQIIGLGVQLPFDSFHAVSIPHRTPGGKVLGWVAEADPIPVRSDAFTTESLDATRKIGALTVVSAELLRRGGGEAVFRRIYREDAGLSLDTVYFSDADATDASVAGLLFEVDETPIDGTDARNDLAILAGAANSYGSGEVAFAMSAARAARARILVPELAPRIFASPAIEDARTIALDPLALVHGFGSEPTITTSREALLHMSDDPDPIVDSATADPVRSMWQTDTVAVRTLLGISFAKMNANAVAYADGATW